MTKLAAGQIMPDFAFQTPFQTNLSLYSILNGKKTGLLFLRYYGCTVCQLDMRRLAQGYEQITATGGQVLVVLQSDPALIREQVAEGDLPFTIICDPDQKLYQQFGIPAAASMEELVSGNSMAKIAELKGTGLTHGKYEGNEQQLPAFFVVDAERKITHAHYGKNLADVPNVAEMARLLQ